MKKILTLITIFSMWGNWSQAQDSAQIKGINGRTYWHLTTTGARKLDAANSSRDQTYAAKIGSTTLTAAQNDATTKANNSLAAAKKYTDSVLAVSNALNKRYADSVAVSAANARVYKLPIFVMKDGGRLIPLNDSTVLIQPQAVWDETTQSFKPIYK